MKKLVREYIYEKFEEEGDPIADMGIGGYSFETLRPGAIFVSKDHTFFSITGSGKFGPYHFGGKHKVRPGTYFLVTSISNHDKGRKTIEYVSSIDKDRIEKARDEDKTKGYVDLNFFLGKSGLIFNISKKMFDYRFKIIEKGF